MEHTDRRATILIVDDDADYRGLIEEALRASCPRADVRHLCDGEELLNYLEACRSGCDPVATPHPDLILLDLNMPASTDGRRSGR